jgi:hypothetical protein
MVDEVTTGKLVVGNPITKCDDQSTSEESALSLAGLLDRANKLTCYLRN